MATASRGGRPASGTCPNGLLNTLTLNGSRDQTYKTGRVRAVTRFSAQASPDDSYGGLAAQASCRRCEPRRLDACATALLNNSG